MYYTIVVKSVDTGAHFKYCFPFLPISRMLRTSRRTDLFIEVTNLMKGCTVWVHFTATGYFPTNIHLSRPILIIDWTNTEVMGISGIRIEMPNEIMISIFTDNDLTHITDDHFEINLITCLLDQIYIVPSSPSPPRYDEAPLDAMAFSQSSNSTGGPTASAPMMPLHLLINPT